MVPNQSRSPKFAIVVLPRLAIKVDAFKWPPSLSFHEGDQPICLLRLMCEFPVHIGVSVAITTKVRRPAVSCSLIGVVEPVTPPVNISWALSTALGCSYLYPSFPYALAAYSIIIAVATFPSAKGRTPGMAIWLRVFPVKMKAVGVSDGSSRKLRKAC
jgi:hypothetical protein